MSPANAASVPSVAPNPTIKTRNRNTRRITGPGAMLSRNLGSAGVGGAAFTHESLAPPPSSPGFCSVSVSASQSLAECHTTVCTGAALLRPSLAKSQHVPANRLNQINRNPEFISFSPPYPTQNTCIAAITSVLLLTGYYLSGQFHSTTPLSEARKCLLLPKLSSFWAAASPSISPTPRLTQEHLSTTFPGKNSSASSKLPASSRPNAAINS